MAHNFTFIQNITASITFLCELQFNTIWEVLAHIFVRIVKSFNFWRYDHNDTSTLHGEPAYLASQISVSTLTFKSEGIVNHTLCHLQRGHYDPNSG